jgi:signal transduction histidine kinase
MSLALAHAILVTACVLFSDPLPAPLAPDAQQSAPFTQFAAHGPAAPALRMFDEVVDVTALVQAVLGPLHHAHPATVCRVMPLGDANADLATLRQILQNLLSNAFKYSAQTGAPEVTVDSMVEGGHAWFRVIDSGVGFDMRYTDRLFGMFQHMHSAADFSGTGVGLAIVTRLVERHGGQVEASATPGKGATFRFRLGEVAA